MKKMKMVVAAALLTLGLASCDGLLDVENYEPDFSTLTEDVNFTADSALCKVFDGIYADYPKSTNLFLELVGPERDGVKDVMILDLLLPNIATSFEGEYKVGFSGDYIALPQINLIDPSNGMTYQGGCYYSVAKNGILSSEHYGFLTEGRVIISMLEDTYYVTVEAKSEEHNIWVHYSGPLDIIRGNESNK